MINPDISVVKLTLALSMIKITVEISKEGSKRARVMKVGYYIKKIKSNA
jgi:hypothetical protein